MIEHDLPLKMDPLDTLNTFIKINIPTIKYFLFDFIEETLLNKGPPHILFRAVYKKNPHKNPPKSLKILPKTAVFE